LVFRYDDNSTQRMLALLARVPHGNLRKLQTIEASTENIAAGGLARADLSFIDGEHTRRAALRDARFCRAVMQGAGVVVFHDRHVIEPAVQDFLAETPGMLVAYPLRTSLLVVELGRGFALRGERSIRAQLAGPPAAVWVAAGRLAWGVCERSAPGRAPASASGDASRNGASDRPERGAAPAFLSQGELEAARVHDVPRQPLGRAVADIDENVLRIPPVDVVVVPYRSADHVVGVVAMASEPLDPVALRSLVDMADSALVWNGGPEDDDRSGARQLADKSIRAV
jgi:hypothetical protein